MNKNSIKLLLPARVCFLIIFIINFKSSATIIHVPADFVSVQLAILASVNSDTILVEPGTYYENINFRGKKIVLTSRFYLTHDTAFICSTVINGSQPLFPDTGSCIILNSGEDSTTVIQGFTITAGTGTKWLDNHGGGFYREGGGILTQFTSPVIQFNHIINNKVINTSSVASTGGGAIRCGDGHPLIANNLMAYNEARYGCGIVFNYCNGPLLKNNLIVHNSGGQDYGGGGVWVNGASTTTIVRLENNTIANNHVSGSAPYGGSGGGVFNFSITCKMVNNIVWGNSQTNGNSIANFIAGVTIASYSDIDFTIAGNGNINSDPLFADTLSYFLPGSSPCIDSGDSSLVYNDLSISPGSAKFPSLGTEHNDMGVYGGPLAFTIPDCNSGSLSIGETEDYKSLMIYPNPVNNIVNIKSANGIIQTIELFNLQGLRILNKSINDTEIIIPVEHFEAGFYFIRITFSDKTVIRKLEIMGAEGF